MLGKALAFYAVLVIFQSPLKKLAFRGHFQHMARTNFFENMSR